MKDRDWKKEYETWGKKAHKKAISSMSQADQKAMKGENCSVCLVHRQGEQPLLGRYALDGSAILVCDRCLTTIIALKFEHPEETEGKQWNWAPVKAGLRMGFK